MKEEERERERSWPTEFAPETQLAPTNDGDSLDGLGREGLLCDGHNGWCRINLYRTANSVFPRLLFAGKNNLVPLLTTKERVAAMSIGYFKANN